MAVKSSSLASVTRWAGRLTALALLAMVIAFYVGMGTRNYFKGPPSETMRHTAFLLAVVGLAVGWLWDGPGALLVLGGMIVFYSLEYSTSRAFPGGAFPLFWIPGLLWLVTLIVEDRRLR
jgi:hypothetical protein